MEYVTIDGEEVPALGYGTARMDPDEAREATATALELGYPHIDTAQMYGSEGPVGDALRASAVDREDVFLTTKLHPDNLRYDDVLDSTEASLDRLKTTYVDLLLIHSPSDTVPLAETLEAMNELQERGVVRHIGVSNFSVSRLQTAVERSATPIVTNQVEYHPFHGQTDLLTFCVENGVTLTAYSPLDVGSVVGDERLAEIGDRYGKTASQVALRWLIQQRGVLTIPKAASREHQAENIDIFDFELTTEEIRDVFEIEIGYDERLDGVLD